MPSVHCDSMNQAASYWYSVPHHSNFPGLEGYGPLWPRHCSVVNYSLGLSVRVDAKLTKMYYKTHRQSDKSFIRSVVGGRSGDLNKNSFCCEPTTRVNMSTIGMQNIVNI